MLKLMDKNIFTFFNSKLLLIDLCILFTRQFSLNICCGNEKNKLADDLTEPEHNKRYKLTCAPIVIGTS